MILCPPASRNYVFALAIEAEVQIQLTVSRGGVSCKRDARSRFSTRVTEDHGLHRDGRSNAVVDPVQLPERDRFFRVPGAKHGGDCFPQLFMRIERERLTSEVVKTIGHRTGQLTQSPKIQIAIARHAGCRNGLFNKFIQRSCRQPLHNLGVTLNQPTVAVPSQPRVSREANDAFHRIRIQPDIKDGLHHSRHGNRAAGPH